MFLSMRLKYKISLIDEVVNIIVDIFHFHFHFLIFLITLTLLIPHIFACNSEETIDFRSFLIMLLVRLSFFILTKRLCILPPIFQLRVPATACYHELLISTFNF